MFTEHELAGMHHGKQPTELDIKIKLSNNRLPVGSLFLRKYRGDNLTAGCYYRVERSVAGVSAIINDNGDLRVITKLELALGHWE